MGTSDEGTEVACGLEAPEGRVLKAIKPVIMGDAVQQVKLEFHDGSFCLFPDSENGLFTATDKETGQELQGRVENLIVAEGSWKEAHTKEVANRVVSNTNTNLTIEADDKAITSSIAWRTSNPANSGNGLQKVVMLIPRGLNGCHRTDKMTLRIIFHP